MKHYRFIRLFFLILWRDFHGAKIDIEAAYQVSKMIHLE